MKNANGLYRHKLLTGLRFVLFFVASYSYDNVQAAGTSPYSLSYPENGFTSKLCNDLHY